MTDSIRLGQHRRPCWISYGAISAFGATGNFMGGEMPELLADPAREDVTLDKLLGDSAKVGKISMPLVAELGQSLQ
jgi:hypothetical protein